MPAKKKYIKTHRKTAKRRYGTFLEVAQILGTGMVLVLAVSVLFYDSLYAVLAGMLLLPFYYHFQEGKLQKRKKEEFAHYFKEALQSMVAALKAGYSVENAFVESYKDMDYRFGKDNVMTKELLLISHQLKNSVSLEQLVDQLAEKTGVGDVKDFARIFRVAKRSGGDMARIMERSISMISRRMEMKEEIRMLVAAKKYEQQIMNLVPMGIIFYIRVSNPGYFDSLYHNLAGVLIMTAALALYLAAYLLSEKILEITL